MSDQVQIHRYSDSPGRISAPDGDEREFWACDLWDATAAEVGAALNISARRASSQMFLARSLRERLPRVNALFLAGGIGARLVATISWRTHLVIDAQAMAAIDAGIAGAAERWGVLSDAKVDAAIDALVGKHDPQAREWFEAAKQGLDVQFGKPDDATGTCSMWGRLLKVDAEVGERRLALIARSVCAGDPRTVGQRRAAAMGAVLAGADRIACECGSPVCPNPTSTGLAGTVVITVVAEAATVEAARAAASAGSSSAGTSSPAAPAAPDGPDAPTDAPTEAPSRSARVAPAQLTVGGIVPPALLAQLIRNGATVVPLTTPCAAAEDRYRPSVATQRFVRCRDMTCRFPGCSAPAEMCDIDHAIPYPVGPTHPSNLRCLCRKHHLLKTFHDGEGGWSDRQYPDGRIEWTAPTGRTYTTYPGARVAFPDWGVTTAELPPPPVNTPAPANRGLQMPKRRRTRGADRAARIKNRRAHNDTS